MPERKAMTVSEFMAVTGLSRTTVYRLISEGHVRAQRFGGSRWLIPLSEVANLGE